MRSKALMIAAISCVSLAGFAVGVGARQPAAESSHPPAQQQAGQQPAAPADATPKATIPAHHEEAPKGPLPQTIDPAQFPDPLNQNLYRLASDPKLKRVLYQQPCYCGCDKHVGHTSLLDCYVDRHASVCDVCRKEMVYAYEQSRKGKTPAQIRKDIIGGDWTSVDLTPYRAAATPAQ
jgi:hypothetical protein